MRSSLLHISASSPRDLANPGSATITLLRNHLKHRQRIGSVCAYTPDTMPGDATPTSATKYTIAAAIAVMAVLAAAIGDGYFKTRHAAQKTLNLRSSLAAMSIQELSAHSKECDESPAGRGPGRHDSDYCAAVWREIEARPLQIVESPDGAKGEPARLIAAPPH